MEVGETKEHVQNKQSSLTKSWGNTAVDCLPSPDQSPPPPSILQPNCTLVILLPLLVVFECLLYKDAYANTRHTSHEVLHDEFDIQSGRVSLRGFRPHIAFEQSNSGDQMKLFPLRLPKVNTYRYMYVDTSVKWKRVGINLDECGAYTAISSLVFGG